MLTRAGASAGHRGRVEVITAEDMGDEVLLSGEGKRRGERRTERQLPTQYLKARSGTRQTAQDDESTCIPTVLSTSRQYNNATVEDPRYP